MTGEIVGALVGIAGLVVLQLLFFAFGYGKLSQSNKELCARVSSLELDNKSNYEKDSIKIADLTGRVLVLEVKEVLVKPKKKGSVSI